MIGFARIHAEAVAHWGEGDVEARLQTPKNTAALKRIRDADALSELSRRVFQAGFSWRVVDQKWPDIRALLCDFDPEVLAQMPDEFYADLLTDRRMIRHRAKLGAVPENAAFVMATAAEHGSFGRWLAGFGPERTVDLWRALKDHGARLGGMTGPLALRGLGKDTFMITPDTTRGLIAAGAVDSQPRGWRALAKAQDAFLAWRQESGLPLAHVSRILALWADR